MSWCGLWDRLVGRVGPWVLLGFLWAGWFGPLYLGAMRPGAGEVIDFYQDWGSARNFLSGMPVYTEHALSVQRHLGLATNPDRLIKRNAHPPTSVLAVLPLAGLSFRDAVLVWNLLSLTTLAVSLVVIGRELGCPAAAIGPLFLLAGFCHPVYANIHLAQWGIALGGLLVGAWVMDRRGRPALAGALIGLAMALKLFPGFLLILFVVRGQWRAVAAAIATMAAATLVTAWVLGPSVYLEYVRDVLPGQREFWGIAFNFSLNGYWHKLFDPTGVSGRLTPLWSSRVVAVAGTLASDLLVTAAVVMAAWGNRGATRQGRDSAFSVAILGMLLVEPVTWDESLTQALLPLGWMVSMAAARPGWRKPLMALVTIFWLPTMLLVRLSPPDWGYNGSEYPPLFSLGLASVKTYAILGAFVMAWRMGRLAESDVKVPSRAKDREGERRACHRAYEGMLGETVV